MKHKGLPFNFRKENYITIFKNLRGDDNENVAEKELGDKHSVLDEHDNNMNDQELLDILNRIITVDEVKKVILKLKNGKAGGMDKLIPQLIKAFYESKFDVITLILNKIFDSGEFPKSRHWELLLFYSKTELSQT